MKPIVVDVREPHEFDSGHVENAVNVPLSKMLSGSNVLEGLDKETPLLLYCRSGARVQTALKVLKNKGFTDLTNGINQENVEKLINTA